MQSALEETCDGKIGITGSQRSTTSRMNLRTEEWRSQDVSWRISWFTHQISTVARYITKVHPESARATLPSPTDHSSCRSPVPNGTTPAVNTRAAGSGRDRHQGPGVASISVGPDSGHNVDSAYW
jgi:hypothetical protein